MPSYNRRNTVYKPVSVHLTLHAKHSSSYKSHAFSRILTFEKTWFEGKVLNMGGERKGYAQSFITMAPLPSGNNRAFIFHPANSCFNPQIEGKNSL